MREVIKMRHNGMSGKERLEAAMRFEEVDRVPWAPKVFIGHYRSGTDSHYQAMSVAEFSEVLNCDAIAWEHLVERKYENGEIETTRKGNDRLTVTRTPVGELRSVSSWREQTHTWHPTEFPIKTAADYDVATYVA